MKRIVTGISIIVVIMIMAAGCVQRTNAPQAPDIPAQTEGSQHQGGQPEASEPGLEAVGQQPYGPGFPRITKTEGVGYGDIVMMLGKPDDATDHPEGETADLVYRQYNRAFRVGEGFVEDVTNLYETFGGIAVGMDGNRVTALLGAPDSKVGVEYEGDATGIYCQTWTYRGPGMNLAMRAAGESMDGAWVGGIEIGEVSGAKSSCGIGIGSARDDVIGMYCAGMYPGDKIEDGFVYLGDTYGFIRFALENGRVSGIISGGHYN